MRHFLKRAVATKFYVQGEPVKFEPVDQHQGILQTSDADLIAALDKAIKEQRGGIYAITPEDYAALVEKKSNFVPRLSQREEISADAPMDTTGVVPRAPSVPVDAPAVPTAPAEPAPVKKAKAVKANLGARPAVANE